MRRAAFALLLLLAPPARGDDPPRPTPAVPRAVASVRPTFPSGSAVLVDATGTVSADPIQYQVLGHPSVPSMGMDADDVKAEDRRGFFRYYPALPDGHYFVSVTATAPKDAPPPSTSTAVVEFNIGVAPPPAVDPLNPPTPGGPQPANAMQALGKTYAAAELKSYADTWDETATMFAAGQAWADLNKSFSARWQAKRTPAFAPVSAALAKVAPPGVEPTGPTRDALIAAVKDLVAGLRMGGAQ